MTDLKALRADLDGLEIIVAPDVVRQKSRDFYWYSPILKRHLDQAVADLVVVPQSEDDVVRVAAACHRHHVPLTARGAGTGNYGQCVPLAGGVVLDLSKLTRVVEIREGSVVVEPGAVMAEIDAALAAEGQELRLCSSTTKTASIGGYVASGIGGLGSIRWGSLSEPGNVLGARIVTVEETPRILDLGENEVGNVIHAYGTTGIITRLEMATSTHYPWVDVLLGFDSVMEATRLAARLAAMDDLLLKELGVIGAPLPHEGFLRYQNSIPRATTVVAMMIAPQSLATMESLVAEAGGSVLFRSDTVAEEDREGLTSVAELVWNHTTLKALAADTGRTYLQLLYPSGDFLHKIEMMIGLLGDEITTHLEFVRFEGAVACYGIPIIRFTSEERLDEIIALFEENGCPVFNPHRFTLEEGGMKEIDHEQLAFKRETDPDGLLNPGKMIGWDQPDYDFTKPAIYLFPGRR